MVMAAGTAMLCYIQYYRLDERARQRSEQVLTHLGELRRESRSIGDVRGQGLMTGVEVVDTDSPSVPQGCCPPIRQWRAGFRLNHCVMV